MHSNMETEARGWNAKRLLNIAIEMMIISRMLNTLGKFICCCHYIRLMHSCAGIYVHCILHANYKKKDGDPKHLIQSVHRLGNNDVNATVIEQNTSET